MNRNSDTEAFRYTYSAKEQDELKKIRGKYLPKTENKLETIRRLDAKVTEKATMLSLIAGIPGIMIFGGGMSLCLTKGNELMIVGILLGIAGLFLASAAYPIFVRTVKKERERIAPEILRLTEDLIR